MDGNKPDLSPFFHPRAIAIVGVPKDVERFGGMSFLVRIQNAGFPGRLYPINRSGGEIRGIKAYSNLSSLPEVPDLAIVCVPAAHVPGVLEECGRIGLHHIHILSAGFGEMGTAVGRNLEEEIRAVARTHGLLVIGPNCMGPYCPASRLTAWGASPGMSGPLGIISQSGGITQRITEYACSLGIGVSKAVSFGNGAVLDSTDFLGFMGEDPEIRLIAMYLESVRDVNALREIAEKVSVQKPIVLLKGGISEAGARTAASHTGSLTGDQRMWEALAHQTGIILVGSLNEWMDTILAMIRLPAPEGNRVFLIGGGGGNSVLSGDICTRAGLHVPGLSASTMERLRAIVSPVGSIPGNPLDLMIASVDPASLARILAPALDDAATHMIVVDRLIPRKIYHFPDVTDLTPAFVELLTGQAPGKPVVITIDSEGGDPDLAAKGAAIRAAFCKAGIPAFPSMERAAWALANVVWYHGRNSRGNPAGSLDGRAEFEHSGKP
jgi:acyl-CoA synthetase (NDP forming)